MAPIRAFCSKKFVCGACVNLRPCVRKSIKVNWMHSVSKHVILILSFFRFFYPPCGSRSVDLWPVTDPYHIMANLWKKEHIKNKFLFTGKCREILFANKNVGEVTSWRNTSLICVFYNGLCILLLFLCIEK